MRINMAAEHLDALTADKGERRGVCEARKHMAWYIKGLPNASALKTEIFGMNTAKDIKNRLYEYAKTLRTDE